VWRNRCHSAWAEFVGLAGIRRNSVALGWREAAAERPFAGPWPKPTAATIGRSPIQPSCSGGRPKRCCSVFAVCAPPLLVLDEAQAASTSQMAEAVLMACCSTCRRSEGWTVLQVSP